MQLWYSSDATCLKCTAAVLFQYTHKWHTFNGSAPQRVVGSIVDNGRKAGITNVASTASTRRGPSWFAVIDPITSESTVTDMAAWFPTAWVRQAYMLRWDHWAMITSSSYWTAHGSLTVNYLLWTSTSYHCTSLAAIHLNIYTTWTCCLCSNIAATLTSSFHCDTTLWTSIQRSNFLGTNLLNSGRRRSAISVCPVWIIATAASTISCCVVTSSDSSSTTLHPKLVSQMLFLFTFAKSVTYLLSS